MIEAEFYKRDFSGALGFPNVKIEVIQYDFTAEGGANAAELRARGTQNELWDLLNWLRAPVILRDDDGCDRWRGYLAEATVRIGAIEIGASLDTMYNRINVVYSYIAPGSATIGTRANTGWAQDDESVSEYGTRELLYSLSGDTPESAINKRTVLLAATKLPQPSLTPAFGQAQLEATLMLRGWWSTLEWTYITRAGYTAGNTDRTIAEQGFGASLNYPEYAQSFQVTAGWHMYDSEFNLRVEGAPTDSLQVELCSDSSGAPGAVIETVTVPAADIGDAFSYVAFVLAAPRLLTAGTTYWLVISRTGALDATNYYVLAVDESLGYASGVLRNHYFLTSWIQRVPDADALFRVNGVQETTAQITQMITDEGQFLAGTIIENTAGVYTSPYRDGDSTTLSEVIALLQRGTTNGRRLLAEVTTERYARVWEEPSVSSANVEVVMDSAGALFTKWGGRWPDDVSPVGKLCQLRDLPDQINQSLLVDPATFFIQSASYDVATKAWTNIVPRGQASPFELFSLSDG